MLVAFCCLSCHVPDTAEDDGNEAVSAFERQDLDPAWITASPGPWGTLEYRRFFLPLPRVWRENQPKAGPVTWHVAKLNPVKVNELIASGPLTEEEKKSWRDTCKLEAEADGTAIHPSNEFRWLLSPQSRALLYLWLAKMPGNDALTQPSTYPAGSITDCFQNCSLRPELQEAVAHFFYPAGQMLCFSDFDLLEEFFSGPEERSELIAVLCRQPYCDVRLRLDRKSDLDKLAGYWGTGNRTDKLKKLFRRSLGNEAFVYIPLSHILPGLPRNLLNTYPEIPKDSSQPPPNCAWTTLNFFNQKSDIRLTDWQILKDTLSTEYDKVSGEAHYGDVLALEETNGQPMHVAIYLGADFAFTKNGGHLTKPWSIMRLSDLKAVYSASGSPCATFYRWNHLKARSKST